MRLDQLLYHNGYQSKKEVKHLIKQGQINIDGHLALSARQNVDANLQEIWVGEKKLTSDPQVYYLLNKPQGYVTAVKDTNHPTILDLLLPQDRLAGIYHIGRLDANTEGLLLLTNNGPLGLRMLHPGHHVPKTYLVEANACLDWRAIDRFAGGITFRDGKTCRPAKLELLETRPGYSKAKVTLAEGKFHQVKKNVPSCRRKSNLPQAHPFWSLCIRGQPSTWSLSLSKSK